MNTYKAVRTTTGVLSNRFTGKTYKTIQKGKAVQGTFYPANSSTNTQGRPIISPARFVDIEGYSFNGNDFVLAGSSVQASSSFAGKEGIGRYHLVGHSLGIAGGIYYSFLKKTGFWKGLGITLVFGIAGGALGMAVDYATKKNDK